jgi:adenylate cyclase
MKIRTKVVLSITFILCTLVCVIYIVVGFIMMSGFKKIESDEVNRNVSRVHEVIQNEMNSMQNSLFTWTQWNDSYKFIDDHNKQFIDANISSTLYTGMKLNFFFFINSNFEVILDGGYDYINEKEIEIPGSLRKYLVRDSVLFKNMDPKLSVKGIIKLPEFPVLAVSAPITDTEGTAPSKGFIVFVKIINDNLISNWSEITHLKITLLPSPVNSAETVKEVIDSNNITGKSNVNDIDSRPAMGINVEMPREIYNQAIKSMHLLVFSVLITGLIFGILIIFFLDLIVMKRILKLNTEVLNVTEKMDFSQPIQVSGTDEISSLTHSINGMIAAVSEVMHSKK